MGLGWDSANVGVCEPSSQSSMYCDVFNMGADKIHLLLSSISDTEWRKLNLYKGNSAAIRPLAVYDAGNYVLD